MRLYSTEGGFARPRGRAGVARGSVSVCAAELEAVHLPACVRLPLPAQARYCRAGTEGAALVGAVKRSAGSFTFALWEGNLAVCDEGDFVQGVLDGLLGRPLTAGGALCAALAALLPPETGAVEALEARAEKLETEALTEAALTSNRFGGKLLGVRKQLSALARYCAQLEDMFEDLSDAAQEAALSPAEARSLALSGERAHRLREDTLGLREYLPADPGIVSGADRHPAKRDHEVPHRGDDHLPAADAAGRLVRHELYRHAGACLAVGVSASSSSSAWSSWRCASGISGARSFCEAARKGPPGERSPGGPCLFWGVSRRGKRRARCR